MKHLENLIAETKYSRVNQNLLFLQEFCKSTDEDKKRFVEAMLLICGKNRDKQTDSYMRINIGKAIDSNSFHSMLDCTVNNPIAVISAFEGEPEILIKDEQNCYMVVVAFNLADINIKSIEVTEVDNQNSLWYSFVLHSNYNNIDYSVKMMVQEVA